MEQRRFGSTDLMTSPIGFGTWEMSGTMYGDIDAAAASRAVGAAIDHGITLFDTAAVYGPFHSERLLAKALGARRKEVTLVTKVCERLSDDETLDWRARIGPRDGQLRAHHAGGGGLSAAAGHGRHRPAADPSPRLRHADRRDHRGAGAVAGRRQDPLLRRVEPRRPDAQGVSARGPRSPPTSYPSTCSIGGWSRRSCRGVRPTTSGSCPTAPWASAS